MGSIIVKITVTFIKVYKLVSGMFPSRCRFYPTCSSYAIEAFEKYGFLKGSFLAVKRLLKCHPGNPGGFDPVK